MKERRVAVLDEASRSHFTILCAAILTTPARRPDNDGADASGTVKPTTLAENASRANFRVGNRASFTDPHLQRRVGLMVCINQRHSHAGLRWSDLARWVRRAAAPAEFQPCR